MIVAVGVIRPIRLRRSTCGTRRGLVTWSTLRPASKAEVRAMFVAAGEHGGWGLGGDRLTCSVHSFSSDTHEPERKHLLERQAMGTEVGAAAAEPPGSSSMKGQRRSAVAIAIVGEARGQISMPRNSALIQCS